MPIRGKVEDSSDDEAYRDWSDEDRTPSQQETSPPVSFSVGRTEHQIVEDWEDKSRSDMIALKLTAHYFQEDKEVVLAKINAAIERLGGAVSPKMNWSCPKDAIWVSTGSTHRCTNADEV